MSRCKNAFSVGGSLYCCVKFDKAGSPLFCYGCSDFVAKPEPSNAELQNLLADMREHKRLTDVQWEKLTQALEELVERRGDDDAQ